MRVLSLLLSLAATVSAAPTGFCAKYTQALFNDTTPQHQFALIGAVVHRALLGCGTDATQNFGNTTCGDVGTPGYNMKVVGLLDPASHNSEFFTGAATYTSVTGAQPLNAAAGIPAGTGGAGSVRFANITGMPTNGPWTFVAEAPELKFIAQHLVEFFGRDLGCDQLATPTDEKTGIGAYTGVTSMAAVHGSMKINATVWNGFRDALAGALLSFGVSNADLGAVVVPYAQTFLYAPSGDKVICNQPDCACASDGNPQNPAGTCGPAPTASPAPSTGGTPAPTSTSSTGGTTATPTKPSNSTKNAATAAVVSAPIIIAAIAAALVL